MGEKGGEGEKRVPAEGTGTRTAGTEAAGGAARLQGEAQPRDQDAARPERETRGPRTTAGDGLEGSPRPRKREERRLRRSPNACLEDNLPSGFTKFYTPSGSRGYLLNSQKPLEGGGKKADGVTGRREAK